MSDLVVGQELISGTVVLTRFSLVRYAGASGDFNPIHYRDDVAASVGLPGVLAHGMLTMGLAVQPVIDWMGGRGDLVEYGVRFTRPVVVDGNGGVTVSVTAKVGAIEEDVTRIDLTVSAADQTVLGKAQVRVKLHE
ncbi:MaoC dehydratase-like protein [Rhodoglobus vestalii]|uniref:MaoC dehydratase-like protein n=1 Tax=Rhodoglobus vestalii TaxID=193384 RepID=A0A8H2K3H6_9MICO|nr:MaoC/PaaZ C-terminal domain-containing protein [Rhodoglobus vestalii]TQO19440.1 MaoC dehydratase-like protein [Rhodoglobus vestalii]